MTPERWARLRDLFGEALDLDPTEREQFVRTSTAGDAELFDELQRLLANHESPKAFVDREMPRIQILEELLSKQTWKCGETVCQRFRIVKLLGRGGMGEVYEAQDLELNTQIAIKTIRPDIAGDEKLRERFRNEILLARRVSHPNVCRIFDVGVYDEPGKPSLLYLTMELLAGETLASRLARGVRFTALEAKPLAVQMAQALDAAHDAGIVHSDFKSANVMLVPVEGGGERAVIADFGLARGIADPHSTNLSSTIAGAIGTPAYMAPEQIEGKPVGPAADVYAFGVVLYEMVTGRRPFDDASPLALAARKVRDLPAPPGDFAPELDARWQSVILRCLEIEPANRFRRMGRIIESLEGSRRLRIPWRVQRRRLRMAGVVALAGALVIAGGLVYSLRPASLSPESSRWFQQGVDALHAGAAWRANKLLESVAAASPNYQPVHVRLADAYLDLDMADRAKDELLRASSQNTQFSGQKKELAATTAMALRDFPTAAALYRELASASTLSEKPGWLLDVGRTWERANKTESAIATYEEVRKLDPQNIAAQLRLAVLYGRKQDLGRAGPLFDQARAAYKLTGDFEGIAETLLQRARVYRNNKKLTEAEASAAEALQLARTSGNVAQQVRAELESALNALLGSRADIAAEKTARAMELAKRQNLESTAVQGMIDLGNSYLAQYKLKEAEDHLRQALAIAQRTISRRAEAQASAALASVLLRQGRAEDALRLLPIAEKFYREGRFLEQWNGVMTLIIDARIYQGQYPQAMELITQLSKQAESSGDLFRAAQLRERIAGIDGATGEFSKAAELYGSAADTYRKLERGRNLLYALANRADMLLRMGQSSEARQLLQQVDTRLKALGGNRDLWDRISLIRASGALMERDFPAALQQLKAMGKPSANDSPIRLAQVRWLTGLATTGLNAPRGNEFASQTLSDATQMPVEYKLEAMLAAVAMLDAAGNTQQASAIIQLILAEANAVAAREAALRAALWNLHLARRTGDGSLTQQAERVAANHQAVLSSFWGSNRMKQYLARTDMEYLHKGKN